MTSSWSGRRISNCGGFAALLLAVTLAISLLPEASAFGKEPPAENPFAVELPRGSAVPTFVQPEAGSLERSSLAGGTAVPAVSNEAGDIVEVRFAVAGVLYRNAKGNLTSPCTSTIPYIGSSYAPCAWVYAYDAARETDQEIPSTNILEQAEYDACGTKRGEATLSGLHEVGTNYWHAPTWAGGVVATVPTNEPVACLGTWTMVNSFTQTFSDGEKLTDTLSSPFTVTAVPISPNATWGGGNPAELGCSQICSGDPVNTATGDYFDSTTDLAIPGRGPGLRLTRTYSSLAAKANESSALGRGWAFSYGMHLSLDSQKGTATITNANGSKTRFDPGTNSAFVAPPRILAKLVKNGDGTYTYTVRARTIYTFDVSGKLTGIADLNGDKTTLSYNVSEQLQTATDGSGRTLSFAYDEAGRLATVSDSTGREVDYEYNEAGRLAEVTDVRGGHTSYTYNEGGLLLTQKDPRGNTAPTNTYDTSGRVLTQTDGLENETTYSYAGAGETTTTEVTNPRGYVTKYEYVKGALAKRIQALGTESSATWTYERDPNTFGITAVTDPNGHTSHATYDSRGNQTSAEDALGRTTESVYDSLDDLLEYTDAEGVTTSYEYDANGNLLSSSTPLEGSEPLQARTVAYAHESKAHPGDITAITDPNGHTTNFTYDAAGNLTSVTDPLKDEATYTYDELGRRLTQVSPRGHGKHAKASEYTTTYTYDAAGDRLTATDPLGHERKWAYDADGNVESQTDAKGRTTIYTYDAANRRTKVERPNGDTTETAYDVDGNVESQTDGRENATSYGYDPLDHLQSSTDPLARETSYVYDGAGNLMSRTDPAERITTYAYDAADELTETSYSDEVTPTVEYGYDKDGRRISMVDGTGEASYEYDSLGHLTFTTDGHGDTTSFGYDLAGNQTAITYPNGKEVARTFDEAERLASVSDWLGNTTSFSYDPDSNQTATTFPQGTTNVDEYSYNRADAMSSVTMIAGKETLASQSYARDQLSRVEATATEGLPGAEEETFNYDENNRLTEAGEASYEYDAADNLTKAPGTTNTYDAADQLEAGTGVTYSYDKLGERTEATPSSGSATSYAYDQAGNLVSVERPAEGESPAIEESYTYDGSGLRTSETVSGATAYLTWDISADLPLLLSDGSASYIYGPGGMPVEHVSEAVATFYHHDQLGSTRILTNSSGKARATFSYGAYGQQTGSTGTQTTPLGFAGQYTDAQSGLIYMRARIYDPATGQFLTRDPAESVTGQPYTYAHDNPLNAIDPNGLEWLGLPIPTPGEAFETAFHAALDLAAVPPYARYYVANKLARAINSVGEEFGVPGEVVAHALNLPLAITQAQGLSEDALIDWIKGHTVADESICDEGVEGPINPLHDYLPEPLKGPETYLPGIHENGEVDFEW